MDDRRTRANAGAGAAITASAPPRRRNPDHPPYAEMVQAALLARGENGGSTEAAISRYIVSAYPGIPPGHPRLLPYYLRKLVTACELSVSPSGRYLLPDSRPCEPSAPLPQSPKSNALPSPNPGFVLRLRKTISDEVGSELKVGWCFAGDGINSCPSVTDQQSESVTKNPGRENQQSGRESEKQHDDSYPLTTFIMQVEPEREPLLPTQPIADPNMGWISPALGLDELKESRPAAPCITVQKSGSVPTKQDRESLLLDLVSMQTQLEQEKLSPPPLPSLVLDPNMGCISSTLGFDEPKEPLVVPDPITEQQLGSKEGESHSPVPLLPSPPVLGLLQTKPDLRVPEKTALAVPPNPETNGEWSSLALTLDELRESLPVPTPIANQQLGTKANKQDMESHPSNLALMQTEPGKEPPPPILMQLQAERGPKLSSPDNVPEKPSLTLGEKKSLSGKPRPKRRRLWYE